MVNEEDGIAGVGEHPLAHTQDANLIAWNGFASLEVVPKCKRIKGKCFGGEISFVRRLLPCFDLCMTPC